MEDFDDGMGYDTILKPTVLGYRLTNHPYSLANMQQAYLHLYGSDDGVALTHKYVRFKPSSPQQLSVLEDLDIDLFDYPLDYDVEQEGDYYDDGITPAEEIPWLYAVVDLGFAPPAGITYEVLEQIHIPVSAAVENEAFRITGNFIDDNACDAYSPEMTSSEPHPLFDFECAPGYHWDDQLGRCVPDDACLAGYHWDGFQCVPDGPPPPAPAKKPSGTITVFDTNIPYPNSNRPVRNARVVAKRFLKIERTYTDNQGQYFITKEFNKVHLLVKFKNDQAKIRVLRRARFWQMLFPVERNLGKFRGTLNNIQHYIPYNSNALSDGARDWAAATAHNTVQEYRDFTALERIGNPPANLRILLTNWRSQRVRGATPMYAKRVIQELPEDFLRYFVIDNYLSALAPFAYVLKQEIDITAGYNPGNDVTANSDELSEVMFHEQTHAAHYNKVGNSWWNDFVDGELNNIIWRKNQNSPYGYGDQGAVSDIIATGESWAYHMGHYLADRKYALSSSPAYAQHIWYYNNNPILNLSSHINLLEDFDPLRANDLDNWIPIGLYYDLMDNRNEFMAPVTDGVAGYTNQQMFDALDSDVTSIPQYRVRLLQENVNFQAVQVIDLFAQYRY